MSTIFDVADDLPCADFALLVPLKRSAEYAAIRKQVAAPRPLDAWMVGVESYFVFPLKALEAAGAAPSFALFKMCWETESPVIAIVATPTESGGQVMIRDIREPERSSLVSLG